MIDDEKLLDSKRAFNRRSNQEREREMSDDLIKALQDEAREDAEIIASFRAENIRQQDEITRLRAELAHERRIWIKAMDSVLTKEQSYLFRDICAAAAALKETGDE